MQILDCNYQYLFSQDYIVFFKKDLEDLCGVTVTKGIIYAIFILFDGIFNIDLI